MNAPATQTPTTPFTVTVRIDKAAALLAGADGYGQKIVEITPSTLTPRQRQTLAALDFQISNNAIDGPISGTETLEDLLDRAADVLEARQRRIDAENTDCTARMVEKLLAAPLTDEVAIDIYTGKVEVEPVKGALVKIDGPYAATVSRLWQNPYGLWEGPAFGAGPRGDGIRQAALSRPDVAAKINQAEREALQLESLMRQAAGIRETVKTEREAEQARLKAEAQERRKAQLAAFVAEHLSDAQQRRFAAGLMAEREIIDEIEAKAFAPLAPYAEYEGMADQAVIDYVADALNLESEYLVSSNVRISDRTLTVLTDAEFARLETLKAELPGAKFELLQHFGYLEKYNGIDDPELAVNACRVTVQAGEFAVSRDYVL
jgi:hypothetical protein